MFPPDPVHLLAGVIDAAGSVVVAAHAALALARLLRGRGAAVVRLTVAEGAVTGLSLKTAGTLLRTIELHTWQQIGMFAAILALRVVLKRLFTWERARLGRTGEPGAGRQPMK